MKGKLKYRIIRSKKQYFEYCDELEKILRENKLSNRDEIDLLTLLIEKFDEEQYRLPDMDPIQLLKFLMNENQLIAKDLCEILGLTKGTISKILNYQKGLSKETIRSLASHFKLNQDSFNRPYKLKVPINRKYRNAALMNTQKRISEMA